MSADTLIEWDVIDVWNYLCVALELIYSCSNDANLKKKEWTNNYSG